MRVQSHGFGVNCDACAEIQIFGQVVIVNMNGHDVTLFQIVAKSLSYRQRRYQLAVIKIAKAKNLLFKHNVI